MLFQLNVVFVDKDDLDAESIVLIPVVQHREPCANIESPYQSELVWQILTRFGLSVFSRDWLLNCRNPKGFSAMLLLLLLLCSVYGWTTMAREVV